MYCSLPVLQLICQQPAAKNLTFYLGWFKTKQASIMKPVYNKFP